MTGWLTETLVWTGLLIALVLLVRRPVGHYFGAKAAYALWLLPFLRLIMPPLTLPGWLAPVAPQSAQPITLPTSPPIEYTAFSAELATMPAAPDPVAWSTILLTVWLTGAAIFLTLRFSGYFKMRRTLLADSRPVGEVGPANRFGTIRLIETPAATAPLAFGVLDKVVALPPGFMALYNRQQRDFVLAHELAHHAGRDLLANMAAQPLFALHWFNPLAWLGWRAMRRDQEAACDARVIALRSADDKASYAETIASFAAGPRAALAAPMACPVLGEKSIIHRLRSIAMSDFSPRRRLTGRVLIGASLLALPLTASISYAESITQPQAPEAPAAPPAPPLAMSAAQAPQAPEPPSPPEAPAAPRVFEQEFESIDAENGERKTVIIRKEKGADGKWKTGQHHKEVHIMSDGHKLSKEDREEMRRDLAEAMAEVGEARAEALEAVTEAREARRVALMEVRNAEGQMTRLKFDCKDGDKSGKSKKSGNRADGQLCLSEVHAHALTGLKEARKALALNSEMPDDMRAEVLANVDAQIAEWEKNKRSRK